MVEDPRGLTVAGAAAAFARIVARGTAFPFHPSRMGTATDTCASDCTRGDGKARLDKSCAGTGGIDPPIGRDRLRSR